MPLPEDAGRLLEIRDKFLAELNAKLIEWGVMTPPVPPTNEAGEPLPLVPLQAEAKYTDAYSLEALKAVHVDVIPVTLEEETANRKKEKDRRYGINVAVQQQITVEEAEPQVIDGVMKLATVTTAEIMRQTDNLVKLTVAIYQNWPQEGSIAGLPKVTVAESFALLYSPDLQENTHYYGFVGFVFQESR